MAIGSLAEALAAALGPAAIRTRSDLAAMDPGWDAANLGASFLVRPSTTDEVARAVVLCAAAGTPMVPQGGRTGLVGGAISGPAEVIMSLEAMTDIEIDPVGRVALAQAGATLEAVQRAAAAFGLEPGIDLAARGSATIGGMIATNAGGITAFRHGTMRHRVLGLEVVLADGRVLSDLTQVLKVSAGYDLKQLFVGSEGTLGIVTRAALRLEPVLRGSATALFGLSGVDRALETVRLAMDLGAGRLAAAEILWPAYLRLTAQATGWSAPGLPMDRPVYLLVSIAGHDEPDARHALDTLGEALLSSDPDAAGIVASSRRQDETLWQLRELTQAIYRRYPAAPSYDLSVPLSRIPDYVAAIQHRLEALGFRPFMFGHLADGNLHVVLDHAGPLPAEHADAVEDALYGPLVAIGGSFSAEHGVGAKRRHALAAAKSAVALDLMRGIKHLLDPKNLMNPGKVLPD